MAAAREAHGVEGLSGYLGDELNNITFPGERDAALLALADWQRYVAIDGRMRQMERGGQHREAVALCTGEGTGESDWAFRQFDDALSQTLALNQSAFDAAIGTGFGALRNLEGEATVLAIAIAGLVFLGFAPRLREYA